MRTTRSLAIILAAMAAVLVLLPVPATASGGPRTGQGVFDGGGSGSCSGFLTCTFGFNSNMSCIETVVNGPAFASCSVSGSVTINVTGNTLACVGIGSGTANVVSAALNSWVVAVPVSAQVIGDVVTFQGSAPIVSGDVTVRGVIAVDGCSASLGTSGGTFTAQVF